MLTKRAQGSALEGLDGTRRLVDDRRDLIDRHIPDDPKNEHISLVRGQPGAPLDDSLAAQHVEGVGLDITTGQFQIGEVSCR